MSDEEATRVDRPNSERRHPRDDSLQRGTLLGRYVVLEVLGEGGMGVVYSAYDPELDRKVAVKLLQARIGGTAGQAWLQREAQAMARVTHPNVIAVYDVGTLPNDRVFVAMELVAGVTLREWLKQHARCPPREVLPLLRAAGEGLAAAHAAGLVHRDFKPANVLVGNDGRVRVMDFGLARAQTDATHRDVDLKITTSSPLAADLTATGDLVGTPAYMAPEVLAGRDADAASDQFSFGAALYEALYGTRPFREGASRELGPLPTEPRVPPRLQQVVTRALAIDPAARYPSMKALLAELALDADAGRRRVYIAALAVLLAGGGLAATLLASGMNDTACDGADGPLQDLWGPVQQLKMARAFIESGRPDARAVLAHVTPVVDRWTSDWRQAYVGACEDTRARHVQSEHLLDLRMACLARRLEEGHATIELLAAGGGDAVDHALDAARVLPSVDDCGSAEALSATVAPPANGVIAAEVAAVRTTLDEARAQRRLGRYRDARETARRALAQAQRSTYSPVIAEAFHVLGDVQADLSDPDHDDTAAKAMAGALEVGDIDTAVAAAASRIFIIEAHPSQLPLGNELLRIADAIALHAGVTPATQVELDRAAGALLMAESRFDDAKTRYDKALALATAKLGVDSSAALHTLRGLGILAGRTHAYAEQQRIGERLLAAEQRIAGPDHPDVATAMEDLGNAYSEAGQPTKEKPLRERALAIRLAALGPDHRDVGSAYENLATYYEEIGDHANAKQNYDRAIAIYQHTDPMDVAHAQENLSATLAAMGDQAGAQTLLEHARMLLEQAYGKEDPRVAEVLFSLGELAREQRRFDDSLALLGRAEQILTKAFGSNNPRTIDCIGSIANTYQEADRLSEAREATDRALAAITEVYGTEHVRMGIVLGNYGFLQLKLSDPRGALASFQRAATIFTARLGANHPNLAICEYGSAKALVALHRSAEAVPLLEHVLQIFAAAHVGPVQFAEAHYLLAIALDEAPASRVRARREAALSIAAYEQAHDANNRAIVARWLAAH
ncbi:MAG TPA: serine/threonine-protein kinase [Kofleriaceae bacterium]|nr:serine/threonine-protein kinase [Kofleriaceae bacterium]